MKLDQIFVGFTGYETIILPKKYQINVKSKISKSWTILLSVSFEAKMFSESNYLGMIGSSYRKGYRFQGIGIYNIDNGIT